MKTFIALKNLKDAHSEFSLHHVGLCTSVVRITFNSVLEEAVHEGRGASGPAESLGHDSQPGLPAGDHVVGTSWGCSSMK